MAKQYYDIAAVTAYIRQAAKARGIDPDVAVRVARAEGLKPGTWQSNVVNKKTGKRERSYGPYQLYIDGGLGNRFKKDTGLDPSDPKNVLRTVDYALDEVTRDGWKQWYGARDNGIGRWQGVGKGAKAAGMSGVELDPSMLLGDNPAKKGRGKMIEEGEFPPEGPTIIGDSMEALGPPPEITYTPEQKFGQIVTGLFGAVAQGMSAGNSSSMGSQRDQILAGTRDSPSVSYIQRMIKGMGT